MTQIAKLISLALIVWVLFGAGLARGEILSIPGTGDSQGLLRALGKAYSNHGRAMVIIPESIGSSGGIRQVARGKAVLARVARRLTEAERSQGLHWRQFAFSPVVFATHFNRQDVVDLTTAQVSGIFTGQLTDWSQLGSAPGKIFIAEREAGDSSRNVLERHFPALRERPGVVGEVLYSTPEMVQTLVRYPDTIGYLPLSAVKGTSIRVLTLNGAPPTATGVQDGSYPLSTPLAVVWKGSLKPTAQEFVDYLFTPEARKIILSSGGIPVER